MDEYFMKIVHLRQNLEKVSNGDIDFIKFVVENLCVLYLIYIGT